MEGHLRDASRTKRKKEARYDPFGHCSGRNKNPLRRRGRSKRSAAADDDETGSPGLPSLAELNALVQGDSWDAERAGRVEPLLWREWLWGAPPAEPSHPEVGLNRSHMLALVLARLRARCGGGGSSSADLLLRCSLEATLLRAQQSGGAAGGMHRALCISPKPVRDYTLRDLRDAVQNLQLHWVSARAVEVPGAHLAVDACFLRFGQFACHAHPPDAMNDQGSVGDRQTDSSWMELGPGDGQGSEPDLRNMSRICIRRFLNVFLVLYRHLHLHALAVAPPRGEAAPAISLNVHHATAAADDYEQLSMHWDLMPAAKLNYIHDFPQMFNCVSQVVFFHNPRYERRMQKRSDLASLAEQQQDPDGPVHLLPCLMQLYPDVPLLHEEDCFDPTSAGKGKAAWIVAGKRVYLWRPGSAAAGGGLWHHRNPVHLLEQHLLPRPERPAG